MQGLNFCFVLQEVPSELTISNVGVCLEMLISIPDFILTIMSTLANGMGSTEVTNMAENTPTIINMNISLMLL